VPPTIEWVPGTISREQ